MQRGRIEEGEIWMDMTQSRNLTAHVHEENTARFLVEDICARFYARFEALHARFLPLDEQA